MKKLTAFLLLLCLGCTKNTSVSNLEGTYASPTRSKLNVALGKLKGESYPSFDTLQLNADSTCVFRNCAMAMSGNWKTSGDSVLVYYNKKRFNIDSLNTDPKYIEFLKCDSIPYRFKISRNANSLTWKMKTNEGTTIVNRLIRQ
ncbi:hypothetical protein OGH69_04365 [Flavobacterium sp. MFBS3-15]|uniref:hypothetical protein n=1 Tax=Flavobacterium sp. MFBS3-15 TaxID=2989816 RepID=UPI002235BA10|nr:hypothetical protein [Flavobacterium sp. MFBS3-15]MCW4468191.1 hypothetical protein [Flavobacterium sp. MFBS3-15]